MKNTFVISLGGSLIVPDEIDSGFLKSFKVLMLKYVRKGHKFILIAGGGRTSRKYQQALGEVSKISSEDRDWMGIHATWTNAMLVRLMFGKLANPNIVKDPNKKVSFKEKILVAGGWMPGRSTDDDAVRLAQAYGAKTVINLSNIDYVYTKDPKKFPDAEKIESISWSGIRKIVGKKWNPGSNVPFDPTAVGTAEKYKLEVIIANGKNLENLDKILSGKKFVGTVIS